MKSFSSEICNTLSFGYGQMGSVLLSASDRGIILCDFQHFRLAKAATVLALKCEQVYYGQNWPSTQRYCLELCSRKVAREKNVHKSS